MKEAVTVELNKFEFTRAMRDYIQAGNNLLSVWETIPADSELGIVMRKIEWPFAMSFDEYMAEMRKIYIYMAEEFGYA